MTPDKQEKALFAIVGILAFIMIALILISQIWHL